MHYDAHEKPPEVLREAFRKYRKCTVDDLDQDIKVIDFGIGLSESQEALFTQVDWSSPRAVRNAFDLYHNSPTEAEQASDFNTQDDWSSVQAFTCNIMPGLLILPSLIPVATQKLMLERLLHRDLSQSEHRTNVHFHHRLNYASDHRSFFSYDPASNGVVESLDPAIHKSLSTGQFLNRKLRWMTLGGQYDWTAKRYPEARPPAFPADHEQLLHQLFPGTKPEAAIVNLYSPGDVLSLHRDVSEESQEGLISLSIGCDGLFMISVAEGGSHSRTEEFLIMRLHSGDVIYMSGASRYAYHGVPQIMAGTCPEALSKWPGEETQGNVEGVTTPFGSWTGWMSSKRVNLNVRQMFG